MATHTAASDHPSATDQQYVKKEKDEGIAQMIASLANEDEVKPDGDDKSENTSSNKTEDKVTAELAAVEEEQSAEDTLDHHKVEDAQSSTPASTEEVDHKVEPAIAVENTEYSLPSEATIATQDKLKEEKEVVPASHTISDIEPVHDAANSQPDAVPSTEQQKLENEPVETDEEKQVQPKTEDIPEASTETIDKTINTDETNPPTESEGEVVKEAQVLETGAGVEDKLEPVATQVGEKIQEAEKELQEAEQPSTIAVPEQAADAVDGKATEPSEDVVEETTNFETGPTETVDAEPLVTKVNENQKEPENQPFEQREEEKPDTSSIPEQSAERSDAIEEKTRELDFQAEVLKETNNFETEKAEPVEVKVDESQTEPEKLEEKEQHKTAVLEAEVEKVEQQDNTEKVIDNSESDTIPEKIENTEPQSIEMEEKSREQQVDEEVVKDSKNVETKQEIVIQTAKTEGTSSDDLIKEEKADEEEETSLTVNAAQVSANEEPRSNLVEPSTEVVVETFKSEGTSNDTVKEEKTDKEEETGLTGNEAQVSSHEEPLANLVEPSAEVVLQISKSEGTSDDTIKEVKTDKDEETSHTENVTQVSSNAEPQANIVDLSPVVAEKVVEEDDNKEPQANIVKTDKEEETSHTENAAQVSSNEEPQANTVEPSPVVAENVAEEDDNKEPQANIVKTDKEGETSFTETAAQVSSNEEPQANTVEPSPVVAEKVVEEDNNKESSITDVIEGVPNEVASIIKSPEPTSVDQGAEPSLKEEREYSVPADVEEKVVVAENDDDKKEPEAPNAVTGSSTEEEAESRKVEEQNEAKTATTEVAESVKVENVRGDDDSAVVDDKKEGNGDTKVEEISRAVSEPVRETLASKFEEKEEEYVEPGVNKLEKEQTVEPEKTEVQVTKESDAIKTSKDLPKETPAKPAQKQSNNIISKVKQSLVKAKKAITGKSPSSKNLSSEAKGDIKVK
ncbi:titin [Vigna radiata var. radiata]|uniref:Titin n=1 Tax=Vigna radiata var. radiata TaxID=3916 RepID=A0A1S3V686_VIGRR|nr:titin [Vigna radiata var. radiata]